MPVDSDGSYVGTLKSTYLDDIATGFVPFSVEVTASDGTVYAKDRALVGATLQPEIGLVDYAAVNALASDATFTVQMQVPNPNKTALDVLSFNSAGTEVPVDLQPGSFVVSQNDELVVSVLDQNDIDITSIANTGDDTLNVDLSNPVDFLGVDIDDDGNYTDAFEKALNGVVGHDDSNAATGDSSISVYLDVSDASENDVIELYADGALVATSAALTSAQITSGSIELASSGVTEFNLSTYDTSGSNGATATANDDKVILEVKVKTGGTYSQDNADVTWEYQW